MKLSFLVLSCILCFLVFLAGEATAQMIYCPRCGAGNLPSSKFCKSCGEQLPVRMESAGTTLPPAWPIQSPLPENQTPRARFGLIAALGTWRDKSSEDFDFPDQMGLRFGGSVRIPSSERFAWRVGLLYLLLKYKGEWYESTLHCIDVPLGMEYRSTTGPYFGIAIGFRYGFKFGFESNDFGFSDDLDIKVLYPGIQASVGLAIDSGRVEICPELLLRYTPKGYDLDDDNDFDLELWNLDLAVGIFL